MAVDPTRIVRRIGWQANKRSLKPSDRPASEELEGVQRLHADGAYEEALSRIESLPGWRNEPRAWRLRGLCNLGLRQFSEAVEAFDSGQTILRLEIAKDDVNKATTLLAAGDLEAALDLAERALLVVPDHPAWHVCKFSILARFQDTDTLKSLIKEVLQRYPKIIDDTVFVERLSNDPDMMRVRQIIASLKGSA